MSSISGFYSPGKIIIKAVPIRRCLNMKHWITRDKIQAAVCITATAAGLLFITLKLAGWLAGKNDGLAFFLDFLALMFCAWVLSWWMRQ
jgi:hypothetical protein